MEISNLIIEITRKCNLSCDHCLRGDAQKLNMHDNHLISILKQISYIYSITFSGGEPSLNTSAIAKFLELAKKYNVEIGNFYIATNGVGVNEQFIIICLRLYSYCNENEISRVEISNDCYHQTCDQYDDSLLKGLSFYGKRQTKDNDDISLFIQGNAEKYGIGKLVLSESDIITIDDFNDANIYLNCKGDIINGCNWSYDNQEDHILCHVDKLTKYYNQLKDE